MQMKMFGDGVLKVFLLRSKQTERLSWSLPAEVRVTVNPISKYSGSESFDIKVTSGTVYLIDTWLPAATINATAPYPRPHAIASGLVDVAESSIARRFWMPSHPLRTTSAMTPFLPSFSTASTTDTR